jgi:hypothetical protein
MRAFEFLTEEKRDTHCSSKCCGANVLAKDCGCAPDCAHCNCNAKLNEADVEYGSTKPGKRMHKIGDVYGKKKTKLPTARYKDNRNNKQKGIFKK